MSDQTIPEIAGIERWRMPSGRIGTIDLAQNPTAVDAARDMLRENGAVPIDEASAPELVHDARQTAGTLARVHDANELVVGRIIRQLGKLMPGHYRSTPAYSRRPENYGERIGPGIWISRDLRAVAEQVVKEIGEDALRRAIRIVTCDVMDQTELADAAHALTNDLLATVPTMEIRDLREGAAIDLIVTHSDRLTSHYEVLPFLGIALTELALAAGAYADMLQKHGLRLQWEPDTLIRPASVDEQLREVDGL